MKYLPSLSTERNFGIAYSKKVAYCGDVDIA